jgi:single-strand DNA-binding protein
MSLNKVLLIGNLGSDPDIRFTAAGKQIVVFPVATNRRYKVDGEIRDETEWFSVVAFGRLAEICSEFLKKGRPVFIEGRLKTRSWADAQGGKHYRTEVIAEGLRLIGKRNEQPRAELESAEAPDPEPF